MDALLWLGPMPLALLLPLDEFDFGLCSVPEWPLSAVEGDAANAPGVEQLLTRSRASGGRIPPSIDPLLSGDPSSPTDKSTRMRTVNMNAVPTFSTDSSQMRPPPIASIKRLEITRLTNSTN